MAKSSLTAEDLSGNKESKEKKTNKNYKNCVIKGRANNLPNAKDRLTFKLRDGENEKFCALFLDVADRILAFEAISTGTIDEVVVCPRILIKKAFELNASAVVIAHNHPAGKPKASEKDRRFIRKIRKILMSVDIQLVDYVIMAEGKAFGFREERLIKKSRRAKKRTKKAVRRGVSRNSLKTRFKASIAQPSRKSFKTVKPLKTHLKRFYGRFQC
jgi:DNA repair protein RadC